MSRTRHGRLTRPESRRRIGGSLPLLAAAFVAAATTSPAVADENPIRQITVTNRDGRTFSGNITRLDGGMLGIEGTDQQRLPTRTLIALTFKDRQAQPGGDDPQVVLTDGATFAARAVASDDESLTVRWVRYPAWNEFKLPLETIRGIVFARPEDPAADVRLSRQIAGHQDRNDLLILTNGDTLTGEFVGLTEQQITLQTSTGKATVDRGGVRALAFNASLTNVERLTGEGALVCLGDGSQFRIRNLKFAALDRLECRLLSGAEFSLPTLAIVSLRFLGGCATYLSDLKPARYEFTPYLNLEWPLERDRNVLGGPLRLRGVIYPKGLGTHSRSEVTYRLDGQYKRFQATLGIDDETLGKGSARFTVLVDGKPAFTSDELTGLSPPVALDRIDVTGARTLTLRVDYGLLADIQDHADWCDALLVK